MFKLTGSLIAILIVAILIYVAFLNVNDREPTIHDDIAEMAEDVIYPMFSKDQSKNDSNERVNEVDKLSDPSQIGKLYGDMLCIMADPNFWDEFFDDFWEGNQTEAERQSEQAKMMAFYQSHGYSSEEQVKKHLDQYWGHDDFKAAVLGQVDTNTSCQKHVTNSGVDLNAHLDAKKPDFQ